MRFKYRYFLILLPTLFFYGCGGGNNITDNSNQSYNQIQSSYINVKDNSNYNTDNITVRHSSDSNEILDYLNSLRVQTGLHKLYLNQTLTQAAKNHDTYLYNNNESGHYEDPNKEYFTGEWGSDRAIYAGYLNRLVSENVSTGQKDFKESIDELFSAIYHRFGFLDFKVDEIGLAQIGRIYTYDMANSLINDRCSKDSYSGSGTIYYNVCKDKSKKISKEDFENRLNYYKSNDPKLVIWPAQNSSNIPPVFFEEEPDPLPNYKVSGYPISVEFNDKKVSNVSLDAFSLSDDNGYNINLIKLMDKDSDNNKRFNSYQFAIFPKDRLNWGSRYYAHLTYRIDNKQYTKDWCFSTKSLKDYANRVYKIDNNNSDITLDIISGESYAVYVTPRDGNDTFSGYSIKYNVDRDNLKSELIDGNTFYFSASGDYGDYIEFNLYNNRKIKFIIKGDDNATTPKSNVCPK